MSAPAVTGIVVNYDGGSDVLDAVASLVAQDYRPLEIVVVDNGSRDGSDRHIEERFGADVTLIRAGKNLGFGAAHNRAIATSRSPYVVLLNSDAVAESTFVSRLVARSSADPTIGMVAAKLLDFECRSRLDSVGHLIYWDGQNRGRGRLEPDTGQYDSLPDALFPSGAAALYTRAMIEDVGGFDASFFLYADDADLGLRARWAGWRCAVAADAVAYHRYSRSTGAYSELKAFHVERNRAWLVAKLFPWPLVLSSPLFSALRFAAHGIAALRGQGAAGRFVDERPWWRLLAVLCRAQWAALAGLPRVLAARRGVRRRIGALAFTRLLAHHHLPLREVAFRD